MRSATDGGAHGHPGSLVTNRKGSGMSPKYVLTTAAIALAVVLAHQHVAANGLPKAGGRIGNG